MSDAYNYVVKHAVRGACTCGRCCDAPEHPEEYQPCGHSIDLTFFRVANNGGVKEDFERIFRKEFPHWFDGKEHSYLQCGADIGDQGVCLMAFGLGHLLGVWQCLCPELVMSFVPDALKMQMASVGMITIKVGETDKDVDNR